MSEKKFMVAAGEMKQPVMRHDAPTGSAFLQMDSSLIPGCMFCQANWYKDPIKTDGKLVKHNSDELMMFVGNDVNAHEDLGLELVYQLENDILVIRESSFLFIPKGAAHGLLEVRNVRRPALCTTAFYDESEYEDMPASPSAPIGAYADHVVVRYEPVEERDIPPAPEGFLTMLLWIDGKKLKGAPYMESVWFKTPNYSGPPNHTHDFGEVIGFLGTDPDHPEDLGAEVSILIDGKTFSNEKSFYTYIPSGTTHSPILVPKLERPLIHFSGGGKGEYIRNET